MDFMSRLDSNVNTIDFNNISSPRSGVKIHKRERSSPNSASNISCSPYANNSADTSRKKRYKLIDNPMSQCVQLSDSPGSISPSPTSLSAFCSTNKPQISAQQQAPQERFEFLRLLRNSLVLADFSAFTAALISYSRNDTFEELMALQLRILGAPKLHYMLLGMRRFLKSCQHFTANLN